MSSASPLCFPHQLTATSYCAHSGRTCLRGTGQPLRMHSRHGPLALARPLPPPRLLSLKPPGLHTTPRPPLPPPGAIPGAPCCQPKPLRITQMTSSCGSVATCPHSSLLLLCTCPGTQLRTCPQGPGKDLEGLLPGSGVLETAACPGSPVCLWAGPVGGACEQPGHLRVQGAPGGSSHTSAHEATNWASLAHSCVTNQGSRPP